MVLDPTTIALVSTAAFLLAVEPPLPIQATAMGAVVLVLRWALRRDSKHHESTNERLEEMMTEIEVIREEASNFRHQKHERDTRIAAIWAGISMLIPQAKQCTCGKMDILVPVLEDIADPLKTILFPETVKLITEPEGDI